MRHQFQCDDASRSRRVTQTTVEETLHGERAAANRRTDSKTTKDMVTVVNRTGGQRLVVMDGDKRTLR